MSSTILPSTADPAAHIAGASSISALGPAAYLVDLIDFMLDSFGARFATVADLEAYFFRPLGSLALDRAAAEQQIHQITLANEVLEAYILKAQSSLTRAQLYAQFTQPASGYPQPGVLSRIFDGYLSALQTTRAEIGGAFRAAYPATGQSNRAQLDALLARLGLTEANLTTGLGLSNQALANLEQLQPSITTVEALPNLIRTSQTHGIDSNDPLQLSAYTDALARAETAIDRVEELTLPDLRANLIHAARTAGTGSVKELGNRLHIDLSVDPTVRTTRIASAIEALQSFVLAFQLGRATSTQDRIDLTSSRADFEARWRWLQSYSLWHAAQSVFLYPENFTLPDLRRSQTSYFETLLNEIQGAGPGDILAAVDTYEAEITRIAEAEVLQVVTIGERVFLLGYGSPDTLLFTEHFPDGSWSGWRSFELPGGRLIDAVGFNGRVYLLFVPASQQYNGLEISWIDPDQLDAAPLTATGRLIHEPGKLAVVFGAVAGPDYLAIYFSALDQPNRIFSAVMDRFHRWRPSVLQSHDTPTHTHVSVIGHVDGSDYLLMADLVQLWLVQVLRPNSDTWNQPELAYRVLARYEETAGYFYSHGTVQNNQLIVRYSFSYGVDGKTHYAAHRIARFDPGSTPAWQDLTTPHPSTGGLLVPFADGVALYDGWSYYYFPLIDGQFTGPLLGNTLFWRSWASAPLMRHPVRPGISRTEYVEQQAALYNKVQSRDFISLIMDEWYFFIPLAVARALTEAHAYVEANTWLHLLFDPYGPQRLIWAGFSRPGDPQNDSRDAIAWLRDPFNPHALGRIRHGVYQRHTIFQYIQGLLDWADTEFARDTVETLSRARELYELAEDILQTDGLGQRTIEVAWRALSVEIYSRHSAAEVRTLQLLLGPVRRGDKQATTANIQHFSAILRQGQPFAARVVLLKQAIDALPVVSVAGLTLAGVASARPALAAEEKQAGFGAALRLAVRISGNGQTNDRSALTALALPTQEQIGKQAIAPEVALVAALAQRLDQGFDVPENPELETLRWRIETNLEKIRSNRNYVGLRRQIQPYAPPADPLGLMQPSTSWAESDETIPTEPPPVYRFSYLIERARYFAATAQQLEALLLASFEKGDEATYSLLKARQDLRAAQANITLQSLRVKEANDGIELARRQRQRAEIQSTYFTELLQAGLLAAEKEALDRLWVAHNWTIAATVTGGVGSLLGAAVGAVFGTPGGPPGMSAGAIAGGVAGAIMTGGQTMRDIAAIYSIASQARSLQSTYARRAQEWQHQKQIANQDLQIGDQQITLAADHLAITQQEAAIAQLQSDFATEVVNFLSTRFTNKQLYEWMARVVRRYYRDHLNFATIMARMAQQALAFERQETIAYIAPYYAEREKRDLLVAERLLTDINRLDQHRLTTERRRKELTKVISLASYAPVEFQRLKRQGWMSFSTLMEWFDRDFPGHYMRLIKSISLTVIGLVPAMDGIKATLSNHGISYVMVGPPFDQPRVIQRQPESIAVTAANNGTGLFELRFDDPILLPFEGSGVDSTWTLEMPKGANRFDYESLLDVLVTINYTALDDTSYRTKVVQQLGTQVDRVASFAIRNTFADAWYHLHNPVFLADPSQYGYEPSKVLPPYEIELPLVTRDFTPNETLREMSRLTIALRQSRYVKVPVVIEFLPEGSAESYRAEADIAWDPSNPASNPLALTHFPQRRSGSAAWQNVPTQLTALKPIGRWRIRIRNDSTIDPAAYPHLFSADPPVHGQRRLDLSWLQDALLVVSYDAEVDYTFAS